MAEIFANMNWTPIITGFIAILLTILSRLTIKYAVPWLKKHNLMQAAEIAVNAAEAIYGRYNGERKLNAAIEMLKHQGFAVDNTEVIHALKAAWEQLNIAMFEAGIKVPEPSSEVNE